MSQLKFENKFEYVFKFPLIYYSIALSHNRIASAYNKPSTISTWAFMQSINLLWCIIEPVLLSTQRAAVHGIIKIYDIKFSRSTATFNAWLVILFSSTLVHLKACEICFLLVRQQMTFCFAKKACKLWNKTKGKAHWKCHLC